MATDDEIGAQEGLQLDGVSAAAEPGLPGGAAAETRRALGRGMWTLEQVRALNPSRSMGRRYTPEERFRVLEVFRASGMSQKAFCEATGVSTATLGTWARGGARVSSRGRSKGAGAGTSKGAVAGTKTSARKSGRHFTPDERRRTVEAFETAGLSQGDFAQVWGVSVHTLRAWLQRYREGGPQALENKSPAPSDKRLERKLAPATIEAIAETKRRFPDFGLRKVRDFVARFSGPRVSLGAISRTLEDAELEVQPKPKPKRRPKKQPPRRFERARPGQLWQSDITSFHLPRDSRRVYLVVFLDDHSRYIVSWALACHHKAVLVAEAFTDGVGRFGRPDEVLTDRGPQYHSWRGKSSFAKLLEREGIDHIVSRAQHPQTLGKCERLWQTVEAEFWTRAKPRDLGDARERFGHWVSHYNFFRPHQGIDGMVPADLFFGAEDAVRASIEARLAADELSAAIDEGERTRLYLYGQVGDERIALSGEQWRLVVHTPEGVEREISLEALGAGEAARARERPRRDLEPGPTTEPMDHSDQGENDERASDDESEPGSAGAPDGRADERRADEGQATDGRAAEGRAAEGRATQGARDDRDSQGRASEDARVGHADEGSGHGAGHDGVARGELPELTRECGEALRNTAFGAGLESTGDECDGAGRGDEGHAERDGERDSEHAAEQCKGGFGAGL